MPPFAEDSSMNCGMLPVIEEGLMLEAMGGIEVVEEVHPNGQTVDRIVCMPEDELVDTQVTRKVDLQRFGPLVEEKEDEDDEGVEVVEPPADSFSAKLLDNSILDTILYYGCGACQPYVGGPCQPKGILKKPSKEFGSHPFGQNSRNVSFSSLEINLFNVTLGNHPSASSGPPVMIDWDAEVDKRVVNLDEYERGRSPRRQRKQLKLSYRDRKSLLEQQRGFTTQEVNEAWAEALKIRQQRHETLRRGVVLMTIDDVVESAQRKCRRVAEIVGLA
jgi:hypothetical protein